MNIPSEDVKDMLVAESGLGLTFAINLFIGFEPESPKNCTTIFDTPGGELEVTLSKDSGYERPSVSIRVRNSAYPTGLLLAKSISDALHNDGGIIWNSTLYTAIIVQGSPAFLDWTENGEARFVINVDMQRRST